MFGAEDLRAEGASHEGFRGISVAHPAQDLLPLCFVETRNVSVNLVVKFPLLLKFPRRGLVRQNFRLLSPFLFQFLSSLLTEYSKNIFATVLSRSLWRLWSAWLNLDVKLPLLLEFPRIRQKLT